MKRFNLRIAATLLPALMLLWGCEPADPGAPMANQPPSTRIVLAPMLADTTYVYNADSSAVIDTIIVQHHPDHYVSTSSMFRVQWFGNDPDGTVGGYLISVDAGAEFWTTRGDSLFSFTSSIPDTNNPARMLETHTLRVAAVDNEGMRDPTPAAQSFESINYPPEISDLVTDFADGATVGAGIALTLEASDPNPSGLLYQLSVDGAVAAAWDTRNAWQFCRTDDPLILGAVNQATVQAVDIAKLPVGSHTLKVEAKDLGGAVASPETISVVVADNLAPTMVSVSSVYGTADYYDDGSIFYKPGTTTSFTMAGSAGAYYGGIANFRYHYRTRAVPDTLADTTGWTNWSDWFAWGSTTFEMADLPAGQYQFEAQCRDFAGVESNTITYQASIVEPRFNRQTILLLDKTADGNGRPGSPNDPQADDFYRAMAAVLTGWEVQEVDFRTVGFISPLQLFDRRVIVYYADDQSGVKLSDTTLAVLGQYLDRGGRMLVSGWDLINSFLKDTSSTATFSTGFVFKYLRCTAATRYNNKDFVGLTGVADYGYPSVEIDPAKLPGSWVGLAKCWKLTPAHRAEAVGLWNSAGHIVGFEGEPVVIRNLSPVNAWKTITLGFPLYFMKEDQAKTFIEKAIVDLSN